ncbi:FUSC family protein [Vulcanococcus sp.]|uniref:FUSC family protein n=1 Tax=Vulcanococcus sp. TaxID=2856995 RepID=UPI0037DA73E4
MQRDDLRLAVCVGLAAGFGSISTVPDGYYLPLTVAAVMVGSYGSSYALGLQRVICTLLGGLLLLIAQPAFTGLPFPIGLALMLGLIRFLGGCLGLEAGYKITGMVVVMGWLMQSTAVDGWLGLKLSWTALGVVLALLALHLFWPNTAIREHQQAYGALLELQREALLEQQRLLLQSAGAPLSPTRRKQRHRELMPTLIQSRATRSAAELELGANPYAQPQAHLWTDLERCCAAIAGCITALRALRAPLVAVPAFRALHQAEAQLLADAVALLGLWQDALKRNRPALSADSTSEDLQASMECLRAVERDLLAQHHLPQVLDPFKQRQVARRLLLCYQIGAVVQRMQLRWQELMVTNKDPSPAPP